MRNMFALRIYISGLTLLFLALVIASRGLGLLEAVVVTCAVLFLIFDVKMDLHQLKVEFRLLQEIEHRVNQLLG